MEKPISIIKDKTRDVDSTLQKKAQDLPSASAAAFAA